MRHSLTRLAALTSVAFTLSTLPAFADITIGVTIPTTGPGGTRYSIEEFRRALADRNRR